MVRNPKIIAMLMLSAYSSYAMEKSAADILFCNEMDEDLETDSNANSSKRQRIMSALTSCDDLATTLSSQPQPNVPSTSDTSAQTEALEAPLAKIAPISIFTADFIRKNIPPPQVVAAFKPCTDCPALYALKKALLQHLQYGAHQHKYRDSIKCLQCQKIFMDIEFFTDHILKSNCYKEKS